MPNPISEDDLKQVARLARLQLSEEEAVRLTSQLGAVLEHVRKLDELELDEVEPLYQPGKARRVLRDDLERQGLELDDALANAPDRQGDFFKVPKVLGDGGGA